MFRQDLAAAEESYLEALELNNLLIPAYLNLADLMRSQSRDDEARTLLKKALERAPEQGLILHTLGLLETRSGNSKEALGLYKSLIGSSRKHVKLAATRGMLECAKR